MDLETKLEKNKAGFVASSQYCVSFLTISFTWLYGSFLFFSQSSPTVDLACWSFSPTLYWKSEQWRSSENGRNEKWLSAVVKRVGSGSKLPGCEIWLCHVPPLWSWSGNWDSLCFSFFICKTVMITIVCTS